MDSWFQEVLYHVMDVTERGGGPVRTLGTIRNVHGGMNKIRICTRVTPTHFFCSAPPGWGWGRVQLVPWGPIPWEKKGPLSTVGTIPNVHVAMKKVRKQTKRKGKKEKRNS